MKKINLIGAFVLSIGLFAVGKSNPDSEGKARLEIQRRRTHRQRRRRRFQSNAVGQTRCLGR